LTCARCHGLLVEVPPLVWLSSDDYLPTQSDRCDGEAWQCLNCGNYVDGVILANRQSLSLEKEGAVSAAVNRAGGLMTGPPDGNALAVQCLTQPTAFGERAGMRSSGTDLTNHVSGFFPSEIEWSA